MTLPVPVVELLEHAARHPDGERPLFEAQLESTAALYQVHPRHVELARECLAQADDRREAELILSRTRRTVLEFPVPAPSPRGADEVIAAALALPHGVELLMKAPIELAAVQLQAHPFVVEEARVRLASSSEVTVNSILSAPPPSAPRFPRSEA